MWLHLKRSIVLSALFLVVLGLGYSLAGTALSQGLFPGQANGSVLRTDGKVAGSSLIGQAWSGPRWFEGRPDQGLLTNKADQVVVSGTQQWGPRSKALERFVAAQAARLRKQGITPTADLTTNSGSLVDPDISPADAYAQVRAVANADHLSTGALDQVVRAHVVGRELGFLGAPYVDVLELNLALVHLERSR
jgi:K+-transporting ATPase ATPase C chain